MRKYKTSFDGEEVDLDDPETYRFIKCPDDKLDEKMFAEIGSAICYMDFWHREWFHRKENDDFKRVGNKQRKRVMKLIENFCKERRNHYGDFMWLKEQIFLIQDETENMC